MKFKLVSIKFYWNKARLICLHITCGKRLTKPKVFTSRLFMKGLLP